MNRNSIISLNGTWRFRLDPKDVGEHFPDQLAYTHRHDARWADLAYDDSGWDTITVPGYWQDAGYAYNGVAWYRTYFSNPLGSSGERAWLQFSGVDYFTDIWLNGRCLGSHEGYFGKFGYDITPYLRDTNLLVVRVDSPVGVLGEEDELWQPKTLIKGALERWDMNDPKVNPGGIWNDVAIHVTGLTRISNLKIRATPLSLPPAETPNEPVAAQIQLEVELNMGADTLAESNVTISIREAASNTNLIEEVQCVPLLPGTQTLRFVYVVDEARLWWTWDLGEPSLYFARVSIAVGDAVSDQRETRFGIRDLRRGEGTAIYLNGVRFFQRGANYLSDQYLSRMNEARYAADVMLMRDANLNTVHPFCVIERQEFYDQCDLLGLLIYQDFPLWLMASDSSNFVRRALAQVSELIDQYGRHVSIGIWNFGSQPSQANFVKLSSAMSVLAAELDSTRIINQANGALAFEENPVHSHGSFFWPRSLVSAFQETFDWRVDLHWYHGWYVGEAKDLDQLPAEYLQLVTEFGAQSLPRQSTLEKFIPKDKLFPPDWRYYTVRCAQPERIQAFAGEYASLEELIAKSQAYQAYVVKYHAEFYRRHKFQPCNGAHLFCFNDCWDAVTWSVVEYDRTPKAAFYALRQAMAPVQVLFDMATTVTAGETSSLSFSVVNDLLRRFDNCTMTVVIERDTQEILSRQIPVDIPPNSLVALASAMGWTPSEQGTYQLKLYLEHAGKSLSTNEYQLLSVAASV